MCVKSTVFNKSKQIKLYSKSDIIDVTYLNLKKKEFN